MTIISFDTVSERDMDLLFMNAFIFDESFIKLFADKAGIRYQNIHVDKVELSKVTGNLGESDITVSAETDGIRYGFLIEDKIDAIAMPDQHKRYLLRADAAVQKGEYDQFAVFIVCPRKYYENNEEARKYENVVLYEDIRQHYSIQSTAMANLMIQQIDHAIRKAHRPPQVIINERANAFFKKYSEYRSLNYPGLHLSTKETSNGYWAHYRVRLKRASIHHKIPQGYVDLTIKIAENQFEFITMIAAWAEKHSKFKIIPVDFEKSAGLRISVPALNMQQPFETIDSEDIQTCFDAIQELTELANILAITRNMDM